MTARLQSLLLFSLVFSTYGLLKPIDPSGWPQKFPAKEQCSRCGLCETSFVSHVKEACAFLENGMSRIDEMETGVHGRQRSDKEGPSSSADEARFGVLHQPMRLARGTVKDAQWTGVVTSIAISMLESKLVDAVVCIQSGEGWSSPEPILARSVEEVMRGRGVKPSLAPSLAVLDQIKSDPSIKRLLYCGVGCSVQAFRAVQHEFNLDEVFVLGTNCADNSPTPAAASSFVSEGLGLDDDDRTIGYEFMQDFRVHVKSEGDGYMKVPYFSLPGTIAEQSIAKSCLACFDYTNSLADVVVGYMGAPLEGRMNESWQTLTVRNSRGSLMVEQAVKSGRIQIGKIAEGSGDHESLSVATVENDTVLLPLQGKPVPERGMPVWIGNAVASLITAFGPKGVSFARYSIDYHSLRNYLYQVHRVGEAQARTTVPASTLKIIDEYFAKYESLQQLKTRILER